MIMKLFTFHKKYTLLFTSQTAASHQMQRTKKISQEQRTLQTLWSLSVWLFPHPFRRIHFIWFVCVDYLFIK